MKHPVVSAAEWREARIQLLEEEKAFARQRDALARKRSALPWVRIEKNYQFHSSGGPKSLADIFDGRSQLIVYHFMFDPAWEAGCKSCSFWADNFERIIVHLNQRDVSLVAISIAPLAKLEAFKQRMNWTFNWLSSEGSDFNYDFGVSYRAEGPATYNYRPVQDENRRERPGISVFFKDHSGQLYHTYSTYARGLEDMNNAYRYLDLVPMGRNEADLPYPQAWVRHHDRYE